MVAGHAASPAHAQGGQNTATERIIEEKCEKGEDEHERYAKRASCRGIEPRSRR
jgi:hypothetical protein